MADFMPKTKIYELGDSGVFIELAQADDGTILLNFSDADDQRLILGDDSDKINALGFPTEPPEPEVTVEKAREVEE